MDIDEARVLVDARYAAWANARRGAAVTLGHKVTAIKHRRSRAKVQPEEPIMAALTDLRSRAKAGEDHRDLLDAIEDVIYRMRTKK